MRSIFEEYVARQLKNRIYGQNRLIEREIHGPPNEIKFFSPL